MLQPLAVNLNLYVHFLVIINTFLVIQANLESYKSDSDFVYDFVHNCGVYSLLLPDTIEFIAGFVPYLLKLLKKLFSSLQVGETYFSNPDFLVAGAFSVLVLFITFATKFFLSVLAAEK